MDHKEQIHEIRSHSNHNEHRRPRGPPPQANGYDYADEYISPQMSRDDALKRMKTAGSISISPELFEKLYLSPQNQVKGDLRKTFGNPTPIAIVGFLISLTPLCIDLMGWRGAGGNGAAGIPSYFFFGGVLMFVGGLLEWVLGNTFPATVFTTFGAFWATFGGTLNPSFAAFSSYAPAGSTNPADGLATKGFNASFGFITLAMGMICLVFLVCSLRTNIVFFVIFLTLVAVFGLITAAYWFLAMDFTGNSAYAAKLLEAAGAIFQSRPIKFVIGQDKKKYTVHQEAFTDLSMPVRAMLTNGMQESIEAEVVWEDVDPETFDCLLQFAYNGEYDGSIGPDARAEVSAKDSVAVDAASKKDSRKVSKPDQDAESLMDWMNSFGRYNVTYMHHFCTKSFCGDSDAKEREEAYKVWKKDMKKKDRQDIANYFMKHVEVLVIADKYSFDSLKEASCDIIRQALLFAPLTAELMDVLIDTFCFVNANTLSEDYIRRLFMRYFIAQIDWIKRNDYLLRLLQSIPEMAKELLTEMPQKLCDQLKAKP
ncbi:GPR1/FUN34/YaaH-class plasma membrane protein [Colletotrichum karsti]|uniref:GPR1/FUN34/YaaH-class plasma membrane protein n=1 Tax=Colletotrichum karsti TaxID=1095194 RepID=A0A9P6I1I5_9PEZI|nr:GPR1/FUN34/YaaH-class plasma membrane protein [Colletotrichum karsti]KAF9874743.1 GPR1/FUN34/YaaH-class plasma membrane protein [Colletotrichum karsti]